MKTIFISFIFLLFLQDNSQVFQIIDLKNQYNYKDQINFSIKNNSKKNIIYFVSLYSYENNWRPAVSDIENPKNKVIRFQKMNSLKTDVKKIVIAESFKFLKKVNFKKYKLAVVYVLENDTTKRMQFSKSFIIKK